MTCLRPGRQPRAAVSPDAVAAIDRFLDEL
jgi:hypothetical protein